MKNTIDNNLQAWDKEHDWSRDGDEWDGIAKYSKQNYEVWKESVVNTFVGPNVTKDSTILEIAPGHGRWSKEIIELGKEIILIDLSPSCIEFCKDRFSSYKHVSYIVNDGKSLPGVPEDSVDLVWSFDSFVHIDPQTINSYFAEIFRVLKPGGKAVIHHAGLRNSTLKLFFLRRWTILGRALYMLISMGKILKDDGWRSNVSKQLVVQFANQNDLKVLSQVRSWGKDNQFNVKKYGDYITTLIKPKN